MLTVRLDIPNANQQYYASKSLKLFKQRAAQILITLEPNPIFQSLSKQRNPFPVDSVLPMHLYFKCLYRAGFQRAIISFRTMFDQMKFLQLQYHIPGPTSVNSVPAPTGILRGAEPLGKGPAEV